MFKVGDKVVSKAQDTISTIFEITAIHDDYMESFEYELNYGFWRLASPKEIAAGHRIDNNTGVTVITPSGTSRVKCGLTAFVDMGDDSHIENHISPLCKKFDERVKG
ncbi:hypothetical protein AVENLUH5627_02665 [Acinetobacter venetianus]|uniref:Uncharacterized protein n=1 Tax=Acinetobacter venetianus TaxID=52133 RepID=A0A150HLP2_9GAMM|nr:hypothetical protein [Acinetobacter venetianus]KXZ65935.1 hypothetical protein AVENLUH5627_02665 [Acinetobacter venetianus]